MLNRSPVFAAVLIIPFLVNVSAHAKPELIDPASVCKSDLTVQMPKGPVKINAKEVCTLLVVVRNTLEQLRGKVPEKPKLSSITLNVKAETKSQAGLEITIFVIKLGSKHSAETVQTLEIKFPLLENTRVAAEASAPFSTSLANSIVAAFKAVDVSGINVTPGELTMSVRFGVTSGASGGGSIAITPITISATGGVDTGSTQELVFKFGGEDKKE